MQSKSPLKLFLALGIILALAAITLALIPKKVTVINDENLDITSFHKIKTVTTTTNFGNSEFGTLAMAIISATCFLVSGNVIKGKN